jgi:hypothetical protein
MPVILAPGDWNAWLETEARNAVGLQDLLKPYPAKDMTAWRVSTMVNSPKNDSVGCVESISYTTNFGYSSLSKKVILAKTDDEWFFRVMEFS